MENGKADDTTEEPAEHMPGHTLPEHTPLEHTPLEHTPLEHTPLEHPPLEHTTKDQDKEDAQANMEVAQLQGLVAELREGLRGVLAELGELRQRDHGLEERLQAHQSDVDDKIMGLKNSLNTFKEELSTALSHIKDVSCRQRDMQKKIDLLHTDHGKETPSAQHSRKSSKGEVVTGTGEGHPYLSSQSELNVIQHYFASLPNTGSPHRSTASTQTANSEQEPPAPQQQRECLLKSPVWRDRKNSREETETGSPVPENSKRQTAALELLESERVYVSYLSLLLKANISFNGSEALTSKDKRPFPSSLRFLIQQHLELLHTLQERVLKCQWQGIMGDVFMRLTSKESDFLDFYVSYLKELPECLTAVSMLTSSSLKPAALLESEIMGDECHPSLHTLLLQPVQRIPEYLLLLQGLLRQTDAEHPDYYLLLVCIQQFRSFTVQYHHLLQHNQELLLLHTRKEKKRSSMKQLYKTVECEIQSNEMSSPYASSNTILEHANQVKRSKQRLLDQIQARRHQDWDRDRDRDRDPERPLPDPFFIPDPDPRNHKAAGLRSIPESEASDGSVSRRHGTSVSRPSELHPGPPGSALVEALGEFLLPAEPPGLDGLYEEDGDSLHNASIFDHCSSASSDSSIDIAFVRCPKTSTSHHATAANVSSTREAFGGGGSQGNGYKQLPHRACVSPDDAVMMRHHQNRPLQVGQRKSKSLNGLQLDSTVSGLDGGHFTDHILRVGLGNHAKLERQGSMGSKGSKGCPTPIRRGLCNLGPSQHRVDADKQNEEMRSQFNKDQLWGEEPKWRPEENHHTPLSERSRKDKGGFRNSFKKLFKKKSADDNKERMESLNNSEHETGPRLAQLEIDRGTAV